MYTGLLPCGTSKRGFQVGSERSTRSRGFPYHAGVHTTCSVVGGIKVRLCRCLGLAASSDYIQHSFFVSILTLQSAVQFCLHLHIVLGLLYPTDIPSILPSFRYGRGHGSIVARGVATPRRLLSSKTK